MLKSAQYRDENGRKRFLGQWEDAIVPQEVAVRAMQLNVAVPTNDPRRAQLRGTRNGDYAPNSADVVDLDATDAAAPAVDPVLAQAGFTKVDRSADNRVLTISVPRS